jgi:hypothetical protein
VLLDAGANSATLALSYAANHGHLPVVQHILQTRPYLAIHWDDALMRTCIGGYQDVCGALLAAGAPPHHMWEALLIIVARRGCDDIIRMFIEHGMIAHTSRKQWLGAARVADVAGYGSTMELCMDIIEKHYPQAPP